MELLNIHTVSLHEPVGDRCAHCAALFFADCDMIGNSQIIHHSMRLICKIFRILLCIDKAAGDTILHAVKIRKLAYIEVVRYLMLGTDICDCSQDIIHRSAVLMLLIKLVKVNVRSDIAVLKLYHKTIQFLIIVLHNCLNGNIRICVLLRQKLLDTVCHFLLKLFVIHAFAPPFIAASFCI